MQSIFVSDKHTYIIYQFGNNFDKKLLERLKSWVRNHPRSRLVRGKGPSYRYHEAGRLFQLRLTISKGLKKAGTQRLYLNMSQQFELPIDSAPLRVQQFSYIGAAMLLMELDNKTIAKTKKLPSPTVHITKNMRELIQDSSDSEDTSSDTNDCPALDEISSSSDDDSETSAPPRKQPRIHQSRRNAAACNKTARARASRCHNPRLSQLSRARKHKISPIDYREPKKRRETDAARQVRIAVARMRKASVEYKNSAKELFVHIVNGTTYKLLADQADDATVNDFTAGQVSRVCCQAFAVAEICEQVSELVLESAECLEGHKSIWKFFQGKKGLDFERRRDNIFQSISRKYGAKKQTFSSKTHRAYVWEAQYRNTGQFQRDRRGTAQVGFIHQHEDVRAKLTQYLTHTKNVTCEKTWRYVNRTLLPDFLKNIPGPGDMCSKLENLSKYGLKIPTSRDTVWRWMSVCGAVQGTYKQSYYTDRHNDDDVVDDRTNRYLPVKEQLELRCPVWTVIPRKQFDKFHIALKKFQKKTGVELPWFVCSWYVCACLMKYTFVCHSSGMTSDKTVSRFM